LVLIIVGVGLFSKAFLSAAWFYRWALADGTPRVGNRLDAKVLERPDPPINARKGFAQDRTKISAYIHIDYFRGSFSASGSNRPPFL
jgi:hypothetical protein